jgi:hypothetical protein
MGVISAPVNDCPVGFHAGDLEVFRLIFPPRLIGSPFVVYDGANRALKVSRASVARLHRPGLLWQLARFRTYAPASRRLDGAMIGRTMEGILDGQGVHRGTWTNHRVSSRRPAAGSTGKKDHIHIWQIRSMLSHI